MSEKMEIDRAVDIIEATVRAIVGLGFERDEALQVMLSQIAVQIPPKVMEIAIKLNEEHYRDFDEANWDNDITISGSEFLSVESYQHKL